MKEFERKKSLGVIGLMSGTSLDGLDLSFALFSEEKTGWSFKNQISHSISYKAEIKEKLNTIYDLGHEHERLPEFQDWFAEITANAVNDFIIKHDLSNQVDLIASHGHTIFHEPARGFTVQIGNGQVISNLTKKPVVYDFRSLDVSLGGQGAPLVPVGDKFLFSSFQSCLNLGGISNISFDQDGQRIAFDIAPCNLPLNKLMRENYQLDFDRSGLEARKGQVIPDLLERLNELDYYDKAPPKSLGVEWLETFFYPIIDSFLAHKIEDILRTIVEHEVDQINRVLSCYDLRNVMVTGGGALNTFFIERLESKSNRSIYLPDMEIIEFKEALIFAFLGVLRVKNRVNTFASVTGASSDSSGGKIAFPLS